MITATLKLDWSCYHFSDIQKPRGAWALKVWVQGFGYLSPVGNFTANRSCSSGPAAAAAAAAGETATLQMSCSKTAVAAIKREAINTLPMDCGSKRYKYSVILAKATWT